MGFLLTWHQQPVRDGRLQALLHKLRRVDVESADYELIMAETRAHDEAEVRWAQFQACLSEKMPCAFTLSSVTVNASTTLDAL